MFNILKLQFIFDPISQCGTIDTINSSNFPQVFYSLELKDAVQFEIYGESPSYDYFIPPSLNPL
jgi:hypothetical protein